MRISLIQADLKLGDVDANLTHLEEMMSNSLTEKPDVIVLPEMWNTSFFPENVAQLADEEGKMAKDFLGEFARKNQVNIVGGSVANLKQGILKNTCYSFDRGGDLIAEYDKVHLFSPSGEDKVFTPGDQLVTFKLDGVKAGIIICYDVRFLEWVRMYALAGIDILFVPAAWPLIRRIHWRTLNQARAIENQMFVACLNSVGPAGKGKYGGNSSIIDPWGEYIVDSDDQEVILTGDADFSVIRNIRSSINVFNDRRPALYQFD